MAETEKQELENLKRLCDELYVAVNDKAEFVTEENAQVRHLKPLTTGRGYWHLMTLLKLRMSYLFFASHSPDFPEILRRGEGRFAHRNKLHPVTIEWLRRVYSPDPRSVISYWLLSDVVGHSPASIMRVLNRPPEEIQAFENELKEREAEIKAAEEEQKRREALIEEYHNKLRSWGINPDRLR